MNFYSFTYAVTACLFNVLHCVFASFHLTHFIDSDLRKKNKNNNAKKRRRTMTIVQFLTSCEIYFNIQRNTRA